MPFKSERQRKYLWANHPEIARRWSNETKRRRKRKNRIPRKDKNGYY